MGIGALRSKIHPLFNFQKRIKLTFILYIYIYNSIKYTFHLKRGLELTLIRAPSADILCTKKYPNGRIFFFFYQIFQRNSKITRKRSVTKYQLKILKTYNELCKKRQKIKMDKKNKNK